MAKINVKGTEIAIFNRKEEDYICITDIARHKDSQRTDYIIQNWLRNRNTIEFLGIWEQLNNPGFKPIEFDGFKKQAGLNSFTLTPSQWIEKTNSQAPHMVAYRLVFQRLCASIAVN
ncbi:MAG: KilA-N domain-containing protein [bacterium]|nr:MAG: KilA-N domain-containing protein [bacterium]